VKGAGAGWGGGGATGAGSNEPVFGCVLFIVFGSRADARNGPIVTEEEVVVVWFTVLKRPPREKKRPRSRCSLASRRLFEARCTHRCFYHRAFS
jgi:hypothetical protein